MMNLETLSVILGIIVVFSGFSIWLLKTLFKAYDFYGRVEKLEEQSPKIIKRIDTFQAEFQNYFLKKEQADKEFYKRVDRRLDRLERGVSIYIAKNKGTIPPLGED